MMLVLWVKLARQAEAAKPAIGIARFSPL